MRFTGSFLLIISAAIILKAAVSSAQEPSQEFKVKYESAEYIYIEGGGADGISEGDTLGIFKGDSLLARIEIVYASQHSSSCKVISGAKSGLIGFSAQITGHKPEPEKLTEPEIKDQERRAIEERIEAGKTEEPKRARAEVKGNVAIQLYSVDDKNVTNLDLFQPTLRLNFEIGNLFNERWSLKVKSRTRYTDRTRSYNSNVSDTEWRNKVYEVSLNYNGAGRGPGFRLGRIIAGSFSGVGYIDGLMLYNRFSEPLEVGIFTGTQPEWQYADFQTSLQKYGAYVNFKKGEPRKTRFESTVALVAEYHSSTVSREFIHLKNRVSNSGKWNIYQSLDLDINRDWRKEKTGKSLSVTGLYISGSVNPYRWVRARLSYDDRQRYWYYEIQTLDERLFDDRNRRGIKSDLSFSLPMNYYISLNLGYRGIEGESDSRTSWTANLRKSNFTRFRISYGLSYTAFSDIFSEGQRYSFKINKYIKSSNVGLEYGRYSYDYNVFESKRSSRWLRGEAFVRLTRNFYTSLNLQRSTGDDINGYTALTELGYRF